MRPLTTKRLDAIRQAIEKATPLEKWEFFANYPFYVQVKKPASSLSKHDDTRSDLWRVEDGELLALAVHQIGKLEKALRIAIKGIENLTCANPSPDLSHHKYVDAFRWIDIYSEELFSEIEGVLE